MVGGARPAALAGSLAAAVLVTSPAPAATLSVSYYEHNAGEQHLLFQDQGAEVNHLRVERVGDSVA